MSTNSIELPADVEELKKLVLTLQKQLAAAGVDPSAASISLDKAKEMLTAALTRLMEGDQKAQGEYDKWDKLVSTHPEHLEEQEKKEKEWEDEMEKKCKAALEEMKKIIPSNIKQMKKDEVEGLPGMHASLAKRLLRKKALWLLHVPTEDISKYHAADLMVKFSINGLDFRELKALYAVVPKTMDNDADGRKTEWRIQLKRKLREYSDKEISGNLPQSKLISPDYSEKKITSRRRSTGSMKNPFGKKKIGGTGGMGNLAAMLEMKFKSKGMKNSPGPSKTKKNSKVKGKLGGIASKLEGKLFNKGGGLLGGKIKNRRASISGPMTSNNKLKSTKIKGIASALEGKLFNKSNSASKSNSIGKTPGVRRKSKKMAALSSALENTLFKNKGSTTGSSSRKNNKNSSRSGSNVGSLSGKRTAFLKNNTSNEKRKLNGNEGTIGESGRRISTDIRTSPDDVASPDLMDVIKKHNKVKRKIMFPSSSSASNEDDLDTKKGEEEEEEDKAVSNEDDDDSIKKTKGKKLKGGEKATVIKKDDIVLNGKNVVVVSKYYAYAFIFIFLLILGIFIKPYLVPSNNNNAVIYDTEKKRQQEEEERVKIEMETTRTENKKKVEEEKKRKIAASAPPKHKIKKTCQAKGGYGAGCVYTSDGAVSLNAGEEDVTLKKDTKPDPEAVARAQKARQVQNRKSKYKKWQEEKKKKSATTA